MKETTPRLDRPVRTKLLISAIPVIAGVPHTRQSVRVDGLADDMVTDLRTGSNIQHSVTALLRQSSHSWLAAHDGRNDADSLSVDPVILTRIRRWTDKARAGSLIVVKCPLIGLSNANYLKVAVSRHLAVKLGKFPAFLRVGRRFTGAEKPQNVLVGGRSDGIMVLLCWRRSPAKGHPGQRQQRCVR